MLCGTMFGLPLWRHRYFETNVLTSLVLLPKCDHSVIPVPVNNSSVRKMATKAEALRAFGLEYLNPETVTANGLRKAIPPAYTHWLGKQVIAYMRDQAPAIEPAFSFVQQLSEAA
jgi:DNA (cytosine-5)-methyltransferase 1